METNGPDETYVVAVDLGTGGPKVAVLSGHRAHRGPRVRAGRSAPDRGRRRRAVPGRLVGGHRRLGPHARWRRAAWPRSGWSASGAPRSGRAPCPSTARGRPSGPPSSGWTPGAPMPSARRSAGRSTSRATRPPRRRAGCAQTGGIPSLSGKDPVGHIHFLREQRPEVYRAAAVFLEPVDYLSLRLTGLARASHDSITLHWVTDNRDIDAIAYDDTLMELAGLERSKLPDLVPTGSVLGGLAPGCRRRARPPAGDARRRRHRRPALGGGRLGRRGRLRRAPLHRHIELDQLPCPVQEDRPLDQHRLHPFGAPAAATSLPTSTRPVARA